ncbi:MAG: sodium-dependent transporter [Clostridia bacterium]|nr:sodium-dependent transporter [Clostridia bacterium]
MEREKLSTRLGFILLSAGCAIGCGNVWRFPWQTAQYGGGLFVLFYIICLVLLGLPIMTMEFSIGRAAQKSPTLMYQQLEKKGQKWHIHGFVSLFGNIALMAFYTVVTGWIINYFIKFCNGSYVGVSFGPDVANNVGTNILFLAITVIIGFGVLAFNIQKGLEKVTKFIMIGLLVLMIGLAIYVATLPGAGKGYAFYLLPRFSEIDSSTVFQSIVGAMNQSFFTLSLGIGSMAIFGSYINKDRSLLGESVNIISLDTCVAILAGLIMFPAIFASGYTAEAFAGGANAEIQPGAGFLFQTMTIVFTRMGTAGRYVGAIFFLFMIFAALSTVFAVFENILAMVRDLTGLSRPMGCIVCGIGVFIISLTTATWVFNWGWIDIWDFIVSNNLLPLGSLVISLFCCNKFGWGWDNFVNEANAGKGFKVKNWMKVIFKWIIPVIIIALYIYGIATFNYAKFGW